MPGPAPAPSGLKILKGVRPARINQNEPKPSSHSGAMPPGWANWMSDSAKRFWKRYAPILSRVGVLTESDLPALRILSELWAKWVHVTNLINSGKLKEDTEHKYLLRANQIESTMLKYIQHFGMSPSSRGQITVAGLYDEEPDYLD